MKHVGFDMKKYTKLSVEEIERRIGKFGDRLYLEVGGKLFDDMHASRVLPGFEPDAKIKILQKLKKSLEVILCISTHDIVSKKTRGDNELSYASEVVRQIELFRSYGLTVSTVVITLYSGEEEANQLKIALEARGEKVVFHRKTKGYPTNVDVIVSEEGYGKNPWIEVTKPLVVVTAPGPGSGKLATCLSQLYHDNMRGIRSGYSKLETFPVHNLPLEHPVNVAYEAATLDLNDKNMIDPFHLYAYGKTAINYNRDIEAFPLLRRIFQKIGGTSEVYKSPTDMGLNFAGDSICDNEIVEKAAKNEILRRYLNAVVDHFQGKATVEVVENAKKLCDDVGIEEKDRKVVAAARKKAEMSGKVACAIELANGKIVCGRATKDVSPASSVVLNALKVLSGIEDSRKLIPAGSLAPVVKLKKEVLGIINPRLCLEDCLVAMYSSEQTDTIIEKALLALPKLAGTEMHASAILDSRDRVVLKKLRINITQDPVFEN